MPDVFISYSRKDIAFARTLNEMFLAKGMNSWIDWQDIAPSADWLAEVYAAIEASDTFVFVISQASIASEICSKEIIHAIRNRKRLVPIVVQDVDAKTVPPMVSALNWIFFREGQDDYQKSFDSLLKAVRTDLEWVKAHTRLQVRALEWEKRKQNASFLLRGQDMQDAEQRLAQAGMEKSPQPTDLQRLYLLASRRAETRRQRTTLGTSLGALSIISVCLVIAIVLGVLAFRAQQTAQSESKARATQEALAVNQRNIAQEQRNIAEEQRNIALARQLASQSTLNLPDRFDLSLLLAVESSNIQDTAEGRASLATALLAHPGIKMYLPADPPQTTQCVAISPDGKIIAACYADKKVLLWDVVTRRPIGAPLEGTGSWSRVLLFTPTGKQLISLDIEGHIVSWDTTTWQPIYRIENANYGTVLAISPDGKLLITGRGRPGTITTWDAKSGQMVSEWTGCGPTADDIDAMAVSPRNDLVAVTCFDLNNWNNEIRFWKFPSGEKGGDSISVNIRHVSSMAFNTYGSVLAYGGTSGSFSDSTAGLIWLWDVDKQGPFSASGFSKQPLITGDATENGELMLAFSPDGKYLASGNEDNIRLWDAKTGAMIGLPLSGAEYIDGIIFSPDSQMIITSGSNKGLIAWDPVYLPPDFGAMPSSNQPAIEETLKYQGYPNLVIFASPNNDLLLLEAGCEKLSDVDNRCIQGAVNYWNLSHSSVAGMKFPGDFPEVTSMAVSPDGQWAATGHKDGQVLLWNISAENVESNLLAINPGKVSGLDFSKDGHLLAIAGGYNVSVWDVEQDPPTEYNLSPVLNWGTADGLHFISDTHTLLVASYPSNFYILNVASGKILSQFQFSDDIQSFDISPDGRSLAIASQDQIYLRSLPSGSEIKSPIKHFVDQLRNIAFSPDGRILATNDDHTVILWDIVTLQPITQLGYFSEADGCLAFSPDGQFVANMGTFHEVHLWKIGLNAWQETACSIANRNFSDTEWSYYLPGIPYRDTCSKSQKY